MKRIIYAVIVLSLLSGCSQPLKRPNVVSAPLESQSSVVQNQPQASSDKNSTSQAKEAAMGSETLNVNGKLVVKNPDSTEVLVNKTRNLPSNWAPPDLMMPKVAFPFKEDAPRKYMRKKAADALEVLFNEALKDGIKLVAVSGYRSYDTQQRIFNTEVQKSGREAANKVVALPGQSEHQTGLAMDVSSAASKYDLVESFENTKEGKWLKEHAKDAGFIIRYPKEKVAITGYSYEPWHIRYVGNDAAAYIVSRDITFDEYINMMAQK